MKEYKVVVLKHHHYEDCLSETLEVELNRQATEGWELAAIMNNPFATDRDALVARNPYIVFSREKPTEDTD